MYHCRSFIPKLCLFVQANGMHMRKCCQDPILRGKYAASFLSQWSNTKDGYFMMADHVRRCSVASKAYHDSYSEADILAFVKSVSQKREGPNHYWLNDISRGTKAKKDGTFLMLVISATDDSDMGAYHRRAELFQRVKLLQHRYPELNVLALCCGSLDLISKHAWILEAVMEEYVTFPILMLKKDFMKMSDHVGFFLSKDSTDNVVHFNLDVDLGVISKAIEEHSSNKKENTPGMQYTGVDKERNQDILKEPYFYPFRNLLLYYPGSISVDEEGNRIFISDSNHHRIIISDGAGKILDCIGSSPGFEDGEFESAKLFRPAGCFYHSSENSLFFVDSENHAIRRADMEKRVVETIYPPCVQKSSGVWSWILNKLGLGTEVVSQTEQVVLDVIKFPWYLMKTSENDLLAIDRSLQTSWVVSMETGEIKNLVKGVPNIMEMFGDVIMEKVTSLKDTCQNMSSKRIHHCLSFEGIPYAGLFSSIANFQNDVILCNAASQRVLRYHQESRGISYLQLTNLGVLGFPYWMISPLEKVVHSENEGNYFSEHHRYFKVLPGRCNIQFYVDIPQGTELVAPVDESCIWRQARGSVAELSGSKGSVSGEGEEKVGVAQQWFDELDNLAFSEVEDDETSCQDEEELKKHIQNNTVHFNCAINISPGTAEVVVSAVLYLKMKKTQGNIEDQSIQAMRILDYNKNETAQVEHDASIRLLSTLEDLGDMIFMKPLCIRLGLECADHPPAITNKETICTDSTIKVPISLD
ncbi:hypothetical protein Cni_G01446 [Canna indica]|uniref:NHL domain-containing protein n=1 Tax=Canna indica TaxID=4628 RepID=A0AAQ3Q102_9LILI|nr:hypothetical protein Cni_G01446 [Canna indica]